MPRKNTDVSAHYKPSLGRVVGNYTREHEVADPGATVDRRPPTGALAGLVSGEGRVSKQLVFPSPDYKPERKGFWERVRLSTSGELRATWVPLSGPEFERTVWAYPVLNRKGRGFMYAGVYYSSQERWPRSLCGEQEVGPDVRIDDPELVNHLDYSNTDMPNLVVDVHTVKEASWAGANLQGADFRSVRRLEGVNFDGADLTGATIPSFPSRVTVRGADLTDARITMVNPDLWASNPPEFLLDATDSNITAEQFDAFMGQLDRVARGAIEITGPNHVVMGRHTLDEVAAATGIDEDELAVLLWSGDLLYRSRETDKLETDGSFDADKHYIPQWEMQRLLREAV